VIFRIKYGLNRQNLGSGKKLKMSRLQNILYDIQNRDMNEQHRVIKENFDLWRGNDKQVDDVLMIGVKI
jgi:hypothetical protein